MTDVKPEDLRQISEAHDRLRAEIGKIVVGQDEVIEQMLECIFSRGHALVVGVPGLAKTLLISTIARALSLEFSRIQFTPDLMPSDITGTEVFQEDKTTGQRSLCFIHGPIFANVVLADEINRTPPKTQAALLQSMQEYCNEVARKGSVGAPASSGGSAGPAGRVSWLPRALHGRTSPKI